MTQPLDELIAEMEAGLEGVTDGEWEAREITSHGDRSTMQEFEIWDEWNNILVATEVRRAHLDGGARAMAHIARCSKPNITRLLDALKAEKAENARLASMVESKANAIHGLRVELDRRDEYLTEKDAENARMREALNEFVACKTDIKGACYTAGDLEASIIFGSAIAAAQDALNSRAALQEGNNNGSANPSTEGPEDE